MPHVCRRGHSTPAACEEFRVRSARIVGAILVALIVAGLALAHFGVVLP